MGKVIGLVLIVVLVSCVSKSPVEVKQEWKGKMHHLSIVLSELMPYVANQDLFFAKRNRQDVFRLSESLKDLSHDVSGQTENEQYGYVRFLGFRFQQEVTFAHELVKEERIHYAHRQLSKVLNYCFACHTQSNHGVEFKYLKSPPSLQKLSGFQKAEYMVATRQFEEALDEYDHALRREKVPPKQWVQGTLQSLAIAIRVRKNPNLALEVVSRWLDKPSAIPPSMKYSIQKWRQDIKVWKQEKGQSLDPKKKLKKAKTLAQKAWTVQSKKKEWLGYIYSLRASGLLNEILKSTKVEDKVYSEALFYSGLVSEDLRAINFGSLHQDYYEACVRNTPNTRIAKECYIKFEANTLRSLRVSYFNHSEREMGIDKLKELKKLAFGTLQ